MNAHNLEPPDGEPLPPIETLEDFKRRVAADLAKPFVSKFGAMFLNDLDAPGEEHEFLIDGWLSVGDRSVIGGPSQSGKSFLAIHAGMCVATGRSFFGAAVKPGLVVYQAGEGARGVKKRLRAWRAHHEATFDRNTPFVMLRSPIDLYRADGDTPKLLEEIAAIAAMFDLPLRMVVIDTLATATGGADENSGRDMGLVMANVAKINAATKAHVCLVHHMNAGGTKLRGHTSIYANIDQVVLVTRNEVTKVRTAFLDKQKDEESGARLQFELKSIELGLDSTGRMMTSCVCLPLGQKDAIRREEEKKGAPLTAEEVVFMRALFAAEKAHGLPVPADMNLKANVRTLVPYEDVKRAWAIAQPSDVMPIEGESEEAVEAAKKRHREALKKKLQRLREKLSGWGVMGAAELGAEKLSVVYWTGKPLRAFPHTLPREEPQPEIPAMDEATRSELDDVQF